MHSPFLGYERAKSSKIMIGTFREVAKQKMTYITCGEVHKCINTIETNNNT